MVEHSSRKFYKILFEYEIGWAKRRIIFLEWCNKEMHKNKINKFLWVTISEPQGKYKINRNYGYRFQCIWQYVVNKVAEM